MTTAHGNKGDRRYFYYVSVAHTIRKAGGSLPRVSAPRLEAFLSEKLSPLLDRNWLAAAAGQVFGAIRRVELSSKRLVIELDPECLEQIPGASARVECEHALAPLSRRRRVIQASTVEPRIDRALVRGIVQARRWHELLASGEAASIEALAEREDVSPVYMGELLPLACLAPDLVEAILDGRQPSQLSLIGLINAGLPMRWAEQRALFSQLN